MQASQISQTAAPPAPDTARTVLLFLIVILAARLCFDSADIALTETLNADPRLYLALAFSIPTLVLLAVVLVMYLRRTDDQSALRLVLVVAMLVIALQIVLRTEAPVLLRLDTNFGGIGAGGARLAGFSRARSRLAVGLLFIMLCGIAGSRISGRRPAVWWLLLCWVLSVVTVVTVSTIETTLLDLLPLIAQGLALGALILFIGFLAELEAAERFRLGAANRQLLEQGKALAQLATSRERMRMARDLHDTVAHSLAGLVFQLDALGMVIKKSPESALKMVADAQRVARQGLVDARSAITDLRAGLVEDSGLADALQQHIENTRVLQRVPITFERTGHNSGANDGLSTEQADALFRVAQEAIHNATHHAHAKHIRVSIATDVLSDVDEKQLTLQVADDGRGFDPNAVPNGHYGLRGMRERAELARAHLKISSEIGKGTTISVSVDIQP